MKCTHLHELMEDIVVFGQGVGEVSCMLIHLALLSFIYIYNINNYIYMLQHQLYHEIIFRTFKFGSCHVLPTPGLGGSKS